MVIGLFMVAAAAAVLAAWSMFDEARR